MIDDSFTQVISLAASTENTQELKSYWEKRYNELFTKDLFRLSAKTFELALSNEAISKPATTYGDIVLVKHLDKNNYIDEISFQSTIETAVRFLDSLVDKINFASEAKEIVQEYRKIGIGIADFKEYLNLRSAISELDEIDYIGNLISSSSYRASESLAEEKGVCTGWNKVNKHLRPKSFEYWYNTDTGEIKSGLEMIEEFDRETVKQSEYEVVPRRNVALLLVPIELEWRIWADRDQSAPATEISRTDTSSTDQRVEMDKTSDVEVLKDIEEDSTIFDEEEIAESNQDMPSKAQELNNLKETNTIDKEDFNEDNSQELIGNDLNPELDPVNDIPEFEALEQTNNDDLEKDNIETEITQPSNQKMDDNFESILDQASENYTNDLELGNTLDEFAIGNQEITSNHKDDSFDNLEQSITGRQIDNGNSVQDALDSLKIEKSDPEPIDSIEPVLPFVEKINPTYQIGELVQVKNSENLQYKQIYQVINIIDEGYQVKYKLAGGGSELDDLLWTENDLKSVELTDILDKVNTPTQAPKFEIKEEVVNYLNALIIKDKKFLLELSFDNTDLPGGELPKNLPPEQALKEILFNKYGFKVAAIEEIGSTLTPSISLEMPSKLHLGFAIEIENDIEDNESLSWHNLNQLSSIPTYIQNLILKYNLKKSRENISSLQGSDNLNNQTQQNYTLQNQDSKLDYMKQALLNSQNILNNKNINLYTSMSKYVLKLEQLIKTNNYGDILITFQYDEEGPKLVTAEGQELSAELKHLLDTILSLINFSLAKNISPYDIAPVLESEPQDGIHLPMNDLLKVLALSLREIPAKVGEISPNTLAKANSPIGNQAKSTDTSEELSELPPQVDEPEDHEKNDSMDFMNSFMDDGK